MGKGEMEHSRVDAEVESGGRIPKVLLATLSATLLVLVVLVSMGHDSDGQFVPLEVRAKIGGVKQHGDKLPYATQLAGSSPFRVFSSIPGRSHSTHYTAKVRAHGSEWSDAMVLESTAKTACDSSNKNCVGCGYFSHLNGWTQSWLNLEVNEVDTIEILIQRKSSPIQRAIVVPASSGAKVKSIGSDGVVVQLTKNARFHLDVDGGMNEVDTGMYYNGPPMHTMAVFANPMLQAPDVSDPNVIEIKPSDWANGNNPLSKKAPAGTTFVFARGVHRPAIPDAHWPSLPVVTDTTYFLQPDAIVHAEIKATKAGWLYRPWTLKGDGTFSGEDMTRRGLDGQCSPTVSPRGIDVHTSMKLDISGVTWVDFPMHHVILQGGELSTLSNTKVLGWRANGDGTHVFGPWTVEAQFLRTQDDSMYLEKNVFRDITTWNDVNGVSWVLGSGGVLENSNAIYSRASYAFWRGGRVFSHRSSPGDDTSFTHDVKGLKVTNVENQDPFTSMNAFQLQAMGPASGKAVGTGNVIDDVTFTDIRIAAPSAVRKCESGNGCNCVPPCAYGSPLPHGLPNVIQGWPGNKITNVRFVDVTIAGLPVK